MVISNAICDMKNVLFPSFLKKWHHVDSITKPETPETNKCIGYVVLEKK